VKELLHLKGIRKSFGPVTVLHDVNFVVYEGFVHALLGSNGAGKSTLMKIASGNYSLNAGEIFLKGERIAINNPSDAKKHGISIIHQEFNLVPDLKVYENVFLGKEIKTGIGSIINSKKEAFVRTKSIIDKFNLSIDPNKQVRDLSVGEQQLVEILKAISEDSNVLIMDEPTAALSIKEAKRLFEVIYSLKSQGIGIIYISHRLDEIQEICDYISVMRNGRNVADGNIDSFTNEKIIEYMVGSKIKNMFPIKNNKKGEEVLEVKNLSNNFIEDVSFKVHKGETVGVFGLIGSGHANLLDTLFGLNKIKEGNIYFKGEPVKIASPIDAKKTGLAYVTENRKEDGIIPDLGTAENITIPNMGKYSSFFIKKSKTIKKEGQFYKDKLNIKLNSLAQPIKNLSGGNQQKVVLGKWLATDPKVILLNEPTRGIDVGARTEIYTLLNNLTKDDDKAVVLSSSDSEEVIGLSDRILVFFQGEIIAEISSNDATDEKLMEYASGVINK